MHSLAPALTLTLTLTLNHLANKPQQTINTLFGLKYPTTAQRTINIFTADYNHFRKPLIENDFRSSDRVKEVSAVLIRERRLFRSARPEVRRQFESGV